MIHPDYNTYEDYSQYTQFLICHGFTVKKAVYIANVMRLRMMAKRIRNQRKALRVYRRRLSFHRKKDYSRSDLACIIVPYTDKLSTIPAYHRYVAWVLKDGVRQAPKRLGISRMGLYRWIVANHYALSRHPGLVGGPPYERPHKGKSLSATVDESLLHRD